MLVNQVDGELVFPKAFAVGHGPVKVRKDCTNSCLAGRAGVLCFEEYLIVIDLLLLKLFGVNL
jgi:hypothetical protein